MSDVLIALVLLTVSAAAVARGELLLSLVSCGPTSTALSFDYFFTVPYDQFAIRGAQGVVTTVALIASAAPTPPAGRAWSACATGSRP